MIGGKVGIREYLLIMPLQSPIISILTGCDVPCLGFSKKKTPTLVLLHLLRFARFLQSGVDKLNRRRSPYHPGSNSTRQGVMHHKLTSTCSMLRLENTHIYLPLKNTGFRRPPESERHSRKVMCSFAQMEHLLWNSHRGDIKSIAFQLFESGE